MGWIPKEAVTDPSKTLKVEPGKAMKIFEKLNTITILIYTKDLARCAESIRAKAKRGIYTKKWRLRYFDRGIT